MLNFNEEEYSAAVAYGQVLKSLPVYDYKYYSDLVHMSPNSEPRSKYLKPLTTQKYLVERNDKCPCESGKKFKNCCMV